MVSTVGFGGCVVGGVYPDKGDLEEIFQVLGDGLLVIIQLLVVSICFSSAWRLESNQE